MDLHIENCGRAAGSATRALWRRATPPRTWATTVLQALEVDFRDSRDSSLARVGGVAERRAPVGNAERAKYRIAKVERGDITAYVSATGTLNPVIMVQVGTQVSGTIDKLLVDFNSTVVRGQQLAQLDQATFRAKVMQAEANLDNAHADVKNALANVHNMRASIEMAQAEVASRSAQLERARVSIDDTKRILERQQALFERSLLPRNEVETAQTAYDVAVAQHNAAQADLESAEAKLRAARAQLVAAEAQVEKAKAQVHQAQAALEQAQVDLERTVIRSPVTGTVISRSVDVGQTVAASLQSPTLFTIAQDLSQNAGGHECQRSRYWPGGGWPGGDVYGGRLCGASHARHGARHSLSAYHGAKCREL